MSSRLFLGRALGLMLLIALLPACTGYRDTYRDTHRDENDAFRRSETELEASRERSAVKCATPADCAQAWSRARLFVQTHSPTPIANSTDDTIETRMPHEFGIAYFWAVRQTAEDGTTTIRLKGMCRGMYSTDNGPGWTYARCAGQLLQAQLEFVRDVGGVR
ncbi:hypothetical protein SAMN05421548_11533 [Paraburkholderia lycopersici]|uniref:Uncharacterized protein n=2 Tax=Paraburkholderia lycopersici TaxID=416944 RepID=A0A1G6SE30_9BURK|nr:hypothetical protein SAMN05421548_11533 [Paraburkholderia lycopersici]